MEVDRILIFDADGRDGPVLGHALSAHGVTTHCTDDAALAAASCAAMQVDAALFCLAGDESELSLLEQVRMHSPSLAILIVTATDAIELRVRGMHCGASDYLLHPVEPDYLLARLATAVRRSREIAPLRLLRRGSVMLDVDTGRLGDGSRWTRLTPTERQAFAILFEHGDRPVSKSRIKKTLTAGDDMSDNAVEVVIYRLRAKARAWGMRIRTCRGMGYVLELNK